MALMVWRRASLHSQVATHMAQRLLLLGALSLCSIVEKYWKRICMNFVLCSWELLFESLSTTEMFYTESNSEMLEKCLGIDKESESSLEKLPTNFEQPKLWLESSLQTFEKHKLLLELFVCSETVGVTKFPRVVAKISL